MITIIYAYRNRETERLKASLNSLMHQTDKNFKLIFIDYGSSDGFSKEVKSIVSDFSFVDYFYIGHPGLLWNKSKALNYGIQKSQTEFILTSDVDILYPKNTVEILNKISNKNNFYLFKVGYLSEKTSFENINKYPFVELQPTHIGDTFGIGLYPKVALEKIYGYDEFFHFYGSEDADLNARMKHAGYQLVNENLVFLHIWHPRYPQKKDNQLTVQPRIAHAMRLNQARFKRQDELKRYLSINQNDWTKYISYSDWERLNKTDEEINFSNLKVNIHHFMNEEIYSYTNKVISVTFFTDSYYNSIKYRLKKVLGKQNQSYMSMKEINDFVLEVIVCRFRHHNYSYEVSSDLTKIKLVIEL